MSRGREEEALAVLVKYHGNGIADPMVLYEFEEMKRGVVEERENKKYGWSHLFKTKGMRKRSYTMIGLAICGQWSGNSMISTYLNQVLTTVGITNKPSQLGLNVGLSVWNFFWGFSAGYNADRFGRRTIFLTSCFGMLATFTALTICTAEYVNTGSVAAGDTTNTVHLFVLGVLLDRLRLRDAAVLHRDRAHVDPEQSALSLGHHPAVHDHLQHLREPHRVRQPRLEILHHLRLLHRRHHSLHLLLRPRDKGVHA